MAKKSTRYYVTFGLLYPSALGAALAWWIPAVAELSRDRTWDMLWRIGFGLWFIGYHSVWFVHLANAGEDTKFEYPVRAFMSDLVDVVALFLSSLWLGFADASIKSDPRFVFAIAALVPVSAVIDWGPRPHKPMAWMLVITAFVLCVVGVIAQALTAGAAWVKWSVLVALWVLLAAYVCIPKIFGSRRGT